MSDQTLDVNALCMLVAMCTDLQLVSHVSLIVTLLPSFEPELTMLALFNNPQVLI